MSSLEREYSGQWRPLMERLSSVFRVIAVDTLGAGKSPDWPADRVVTLSDEAAFLEPAFARAGDPFAIVGHSYGGAVALIAALANQGRVSRMVVYEPTLILTTERGIAWPGEAERNP